MNRAILASSLNGPRAPSPRRGAVRGWRCSAVVFLAGGALWLLASAGWIEMKATLAQHLIGRAWAASSVRGAAVKPWPWADTWPVARLRVPRYGQDLYVLAGVSGQALAFGPGFEQASVPPVSPGVSVIAGHRDTHFAFLRDLQPGALIELEMPGGETQEYQVTTRHVIDSARESLALYRRGPSRLLLVTCYPFDSLGASGSLRLVVSAVGAGVAGYAVRAPATRPVTASRRGAFSE